MTARVPEPAVQVGRFVRIEPLTEADFGELYEAIGQPEVFAGGYGGGPEGLPHDIDGFRRFAAGYFSTAGGNQPYVVRLHGGADDGRVVGTSTLGDFDLPSEHAHLGWTAYDPRVWGTAVNVDTKLLMLALAFDNGFGRVKIQADERNARSRAAIAKLGATFEGLVRRDKRRADGTWRTTALFSIIVEEWPEVREALEARLETYPAPVVTAGETAERA